VRIPMPQDARLDAHPLSISASQFRLSRQINARNRCGAQWSFRLAISPEILGKLGNFENMKGKFVNAYTQVC
jgi:hypothetical protein